MQKSIPVFLGMSSIVCGAQNDSCAPEPPTTCYPDDCKTCYCLGPDTRIANAAVRPVTCNGDWVITVAGFYWESHQDGMEYAIDNHVAAPTRTNLVPSDSAELTNLIDAEYQTPNFDWRWGFKLGLGYNTTCDGWDIGVLWTWYRGRSSDHVEAEIEDNHSLLPLWSAFNSTIGNTLYVTDIEADWKLEMNLIDIELGREYWVSKRMTLRPFVGLRIASLKQDFDIVHRGGSFGENVSSTLEQDAFNDFVDIDNDFKGVGLRAGLNSLFNLGCGWGIYGDLAASIVYGRFSIDHDEWIRLASTPHGKIQILETDDHFRASRAMLDLALGIQWMTLFCDCKYGLTVSLGWEEHLFFHQNQMWRVNRLLGEGTPGEGIPNNNGENVSSQRRGTLDTQGVTLQVVFEF